LILPYVNSRSFHASQNIPTFARRLEHFVKIGLTSGISCPINCCLLNELFFFCRTPSAKRCGLYSRFREKFPISGMSRTSGQSAFARYAKQFLKLFFLEKWSHLLWKNINSVGFGIGFAL
jgi:hypothetical protein